MHASICDQLHDIVQNSIEAGARLVEVDWHETRDWQEITVADDGCGMKAEVQAHALDPFYTDGRKHIQRRVGLGLAFLRQMVEETGGQWQLASEPGKGTVIRFRLERAHVDVPPTGDIVGALTGLMAFSGDYDLTVQRRCEGGAYRLSRDELRDVLGDLDSATSLTMMRDYIASQEEALQKG